MKLINIGQQDDGPVTLEFERDEFHTFRDALAEAIDSLEGQEAKYEQLITDYGRLSAEEVSEALEEHLDINADSLEDLKSLSPPSTQLCGQDQSLKEACWKTLSRSMTWRGICDASQETNP